MYPFARRHADVNVGCNNKKDRENNEKLYKLYYAFEKPYHFYLLPDFVYKSVKSGK